MWEISLPPTIFHQNHYPTHGFDAKLISNEPTVLDERVVLKTDATRLIYFASNSKCSM